MIGCYDFCGHYEWTFAWLEREGDLMTDYLETAISKDAGANARKLIVPEGIAGMQKYWQHTLEEEAAGYAITSDHEKFRIDMYECPSKGFLLRNGLEQYGDYCDHCVGWIGPMMKDAGYVIDHEHNHCGQCWWEFRRKEENAEPSSAGAFSGDRDVRHRAEWQNGSLDVFRKATSVGEKNRKD